MRSVSSRSIDAGSRVFALLGAGARCRAGTGLFDAAGLENAGTPSKAHVCRDSRAAVAKVSRVALLSTAPSGT